MNENGHFALVPRTSSAIEKAEPGAKRILSGMIADTLALARSEKAKPLFTVLAGSDIFADLWKGLFRSKLGERYDVRILRFETDTELIRLANEHPFDLVFLYLGNIFWTEFKGPNQGDGRTNDFFLQYQIETLANLQSTYGKPIIATQGTDLAHKFSGTGVSFFQTPFRVEDVWCVVEASLPEHSQTPAAIQTPRTRPLRVVILDNEEGPFQSLRVIIRHTFEKVSFTWFQDGDGAWRELARTDPDLLITDIHHPGMSCVEMIQRLAQKKVKYPILVLSAAGSEENKKIFQEYATHLNLTYMDKPFSIPEIRELLLKHLTPRFPVLTAIQPRRTRPAKIVIIEDEPAVLKLVEGFILKGFENVAVQTYQNSPDGWRELLRADPDMLIVGGVMPALSGEEIVRGLLDRNTAYPIVVISGWPPTEKWVRDCADKRPNISFLLKPFTPPSLFEIMESSLNIRRREP